MTQNREEKKQQLKLNLLEAAHKEIGENGVQGLTARKVTTLANCSLGSLYTSYDNIDNLIIHVNASTLEKLGKQLLASIEGKTKAEDILHCLAQSYIAFAKDNYEHWNAVFEFARLSSFEAPQWYLEKLSMLTGLIAEPVHALSPHMSEEEAANKAKTLFAAVHGIVAFSLQGRFIGLDKEYLENEITSFVNQLINGLEA